jgi:hypothetical protein
MIYSNSMKIKIDEHYLDSCTEGYYLKLHDTEQEKHTWPTEFFLQKWRNIQCRVMFN